jgi:hypothetical protein
MELRHQRKVLFFALAACVIFSVVFSETVIAGEHDHDCIGEGCPFCLLIETANNLLKSLKLAGLLCFLTACTVFAALAFQKYAKISPCVFSPVALKIRFNT